MPNDAVLQQWVETLIQAGVCPTRVVPFHKKIPFLEGPIYVLLTRYQLQTATKCLLSNAGKSHEQNRTQFLPKSILFPNLEQGFLLQMQNMYKCNKGKAQNKYKIFNEKTIPCTTRLMKDAAASVKHVFRTVVIDEAHFHKNLLAFWGLGAGMLSMCVERVIPMVSLSTKSMVGELGSIQLRVFCTHPWFPVMCSEWNTVQ